MGVVCSQSGVLHVGADLFGIFRRVNYLVMEYVSKNVYLLLFNNDGAIFQLDVLSK